MAAVKFMEFSISPVFLFARACWALVLFAVGVLALLPMEHLQLPIFSWWDKAQHAVAFAVLTSAALILWQGKKRQVVVGMLAYGAAIEAAQWTVGWRFAEWSDLAADALGVVLAYSAVHAGALLLRLGRRAFGT